MPYGTSINIPEWDGHVRACGEVFRLQKGSRVAVGELWTHPYGGEVRVMVDGELVRSEAKRDGRALLNLALDWKHQFQEKGWTA